MKPGAITHKAVIDWIELQILLSERSNFWTVQGALRTALGLLGNAKLYVRALDEGEGRAASIFRFRIQDPKNMRWLDQVLSDLRGRFDFGAVQIVAVEIAFE